MIDPLKIWQFRGDIPKKTNEKENLYMFGSVDYGSLEDHEIVAKDLVAFIQRCYHLYSLI